MAEPVDICNRALTAIGCSKITSLTGTSAEAIACADLWTTGKIYEEVFRAREWKCLERRTQLQYTDKALTLSLATVGTGRTATAASAHFAGTRADIGRLLYEVDADGDDSDGVAEITGYTSTTVCTVEITTEFSAAALAANLWRLAPLEDSGAEWDYEYVLPSDYLKLIAVPEAVLWQESGGRLLSDTAALAVTYLWKQTDPTAWERLLYKAVAMKLAYELTLPLKRSADHAAKALRDYDMALHEADAEDTVASDRTPTRSAVSLITSRG